jgi:hypothetical protein
VLAAQRLAARLAGPTGLTERASTFSARELIVALAQAHDQGLPAPELEARAEAFLARHAVPLEPARGHRPATYTTPEMLLAEARLVCAAGRPAPAGAAQVKAPARAQVLAARPSLGPDQRAALKTLFEDTRTVRVLEAPAGTGKTYLLDALREAYERSGYPFSALPGRARPRRSWLTRPASGPRPPPGFSCVLMADGWPCCPGACWWSTRPA